MRASHCNHSGLRGTVVLRREGGDASLPKLLWDSLIIIVTFLIRFNVFCYKNVGINVTHGSILVISLSFATLFCLSITYSNYMGNAAG